MNILITRKIPEAALEKLREAGCILTEYTDRRHLPQEALIRLCADQDALLSVGPNQLNRTFLEQCSHLKGIALMSAGFDNVDVAAATNSRMPVSNTPGVLSSATADVAFLLMLAVSRKAFYMHKSIAAGNWNFYEPTANLGIELRGKTLGIFGLGKIGMELAAKCKAAYGMPVLYHNRNRNEAAEAQLDARYVSFDTLLAQSDVLSLHANLSAGTQGAFGKEAFARMKPSAIFINTARGGMHDEEALLEALQSGRLWGAGLDVTHPEPMAPDNPLLDMPNVCVLPHIGSATIETRTRMALMAADNLLALKAGQPMPQVINGEIYRQQA